MKFSVMIALAKIREAVRLRLEVRAERGMPLLRSLPAVVLLFFASSLCAAPQKAEKPACVRANWMWAGSAEEMTVGDSQVYAISGDFVTALSLRTGEVLWEHDYGTGSNPPTTLIAEMAGTLVVARGRRLLLIDPDDGKLNHSIEMPGDIDFIEGPPLVVSSTKGKSSELVSIDPASGKELARCGKTCRPDVADFGVFGGVIVAILGSESKKVVGLRPADFKQLWQFEHDRPLSLACSELGPVLFEGTRIEPEGFFIFSTATGDRSIKMPPREDGSSSMGWDDSCRCEITPSIDFSTLSTADSGSCSISRFSGTIAEPIWTVELDGNPGKLVPDGANVYAVTRMARLPETGLTWPLQLFHVLEKSTGRVLKRAVFPFTTQSHATFFSSNGPSFITMFHMNDVTIISSIAVNVFDPPSAVLDLRNRLLQIAGVVVTRQGN